MRQVRGLFLVFLNSAAAISGASAKAQETIWEFAGDFVRTFAGAALDTLPDVDGDGIDDVIAGSADQDREGHAWLLSGRDGHVIHFWVGELLEPFFPTNDHFGRAVASAGDLDGDGVADVMIGAEWAPANDGSGATYTGAVFVYSGADGTLLRDLRGPVAGAQIGRAVRSLGDINGDDIPDFLATSATAPGNDGVPRGAVFVHSGADLSLLYRVDYDRGTSVSHDSTFGTHAVRVADMDHDGSDDWAIATPYDLNTKGVANWAGSIELHSGRTGALQWRAIGARYDQLGTGLAVVPDWDGDGMADLCVGAPQDFCHNGYAQVRSAVTGVVLDTWVGEAMGATYRVLVSSPGDVDRDGHPEIAIEGVVRWGVCGGDKITEVGSYLDLISGATKQRLERFDFANSGDAFVVPFPDIDGDALPEFLLSAFDEWVPDVPAAGVVRLLEGSDFWLYRRLWHDANLKWYIDFTMGEVPGGTTLLFALTRFAGADTFVLFAATDFMGLPSKTLTFDLPIGLGGIDADVQAFALDAAGGIVETAPLRLYFP